MLMANRVSPEVEQPAFAKESTETIINLQKLIDEADDAKLQPLLGLLLTYLSGIHIEL